MLTLKAINYSEQNPYKMLASLLLRKLFILLLPLYVLALNVALMWWNILPRYAFHPLTSPNPLNVPMSS